MMDYSKLTDAELDERAAKGMGWKRGTGEQGDWYLDKDDNLIAYVSGWHPSTSSTDAFRFMEHALEEHGPDNGGWSLAMDASVEELKCCLVVRRRGDVITIISEGYAPTLIRAITEALVAAYDPDGQG
jgi:hypothetical protein